MSLKYIDEADIQGKKVIARFDFNVPLKNGEIQDTTRVDAALETINFILDKNPSKLILMSHLGRPKGQKNPELSLAPVGNYLAEKLNEDVVLTESCTDEGISTLLNLPKTKIVLLENLRFHEGETNNDIEFAKTLSSYADLYVNDAFGTAHRKHASTYGIIAFFKGKSFGGFLLKKEVQGLGKVLEKPAKPFVAIMGGAKVADKIKTIETLLPKVDHLIIGGAMAYPFLKSKNFEIGKSLCSDEDLRLATSILRNDKGNKIVLPTDHRFAESLEATNANTTADENLPENGIGLDIGPKSENLFKDLIGKSKTVFWNGPMGLFENAAFAVGTFSIAKSLAEHSDTCFSVVGGGDSVSAANKSGVADQLGHVSTGGGASLEFIESGTLPGLQALRFGVEI